MSLMSLDGFHARIDSDEDTDLLRGEILGLTGGADFYGSSPEELRREFRKPLDVLLEVCREKGIEPRGCSSRSLVRNRWPQSGQTYAALGQRLATTRR